MVRYRQYLSATPHIPGKSRSNLLWENILIATMFCTIQHRPASRCFIDRVVATLSGVIPKGRSTIRNYSQMHLFIALITLIVSLSYIVNDMIVIPVKIKTCIRR